MRQGPARGGADRGGGVRRPPRRASDRDPWVLDQELTTERAEHASVIATRPPDRRLRLTELLEAKRRAEHQVAGAEAFHKGTTDRAAAIGPLAGLRRAGRDAKERAEAQLVVANHRLDLAQNALDSIGSKVEATQQRIATRSRWDDRHGWRIARVAAIDGELRHHWAGVVLAAARDDDPLAFGADRLREAWATFAADIQRVADSVPPDRSSQLVHAVADHHRRKEELRHLMREVPSRRWSRAGGTDVADAGFVRAQEAVEAAAGLVRQERAAVRERLEAVRQADPARREIAGALKILSAALKSVEPPTPARPTVIQREVERDLGIDLGL